MKLLICAVLCIAARAEAQPANAQAEVLFRNGKRLLKQGKVAEACAAFDASQKLEPTVSTLLNQANCREKNNQLATAWGLFLDAERDTRSAADDAGKQLHQVAVDHADKLEPRLSTLEIKVAAELVAGLEIRRDNDVIDPAAWNQALPIDGGTYKVTAKLPNAPAWSTTITIANEKDAKTVEIPKPSTPKREIREPVRPPPPPVSKPAPPAPVATKPADAPDAWYCTGSTRVKLGICKPQLAACDAFRDKLLAQIRDLPPCDAAESATCFRLSGDPHCAPTTEICDAMHLAAERAGSTNLGSCEVIRSARAAKKREVNLGNGEIDEDVGWQCTQSARSTEIGTCKPTRAACEEFRAKLLERFSDLSACRSYANAMCFDVGKEPHCAPNRDLCESLRRSAMNQSGTALPQCKSRAAPNK